MQRFLAFLHAGHRSAVGRPLLIARSAFAPQTLQRNPSQRSGRCLERLSDGEHNGFAFGGIAVTVELIRQLITGQDHRHAKVDLGDRGTPTQLDIITVEIISEGPKAASKGWTW